MNYKIITKNNDNLHHHSMLEVYTNGRYTLPLRQRTDKRDKRLIRQMLVRNHWIPYTYSGNNTKFGDFSILACGTSFLDLGPR